MLIGLIIKLSLFIIVLLPLNLKSGQMSLSENNKVNHNNPSFRQFEKALSDAHTNAQKQALADKFYAEVLSSTYPIFENDSTVVLLYKSNKDSAFVLGDMADWNGHLPMTKISGTDLFYFRAQYEPDARLEYWLSTDRQGLAGVDPLNKFTVLNGFGPMSELAMPKYQRHPFFNDYIYGKKGESHNLIKHEIPAGVLNYPHSVHVYLPPGYKEGQNNYPAVYFQDGIDYVEFALAAHVINELIKEAKIPEIIAVFVTPPNRFRPGPPNRMTEYGLNDKYVDFFTNQLVQFIDENYRTQKRPESRLVVGDSFGGLISAYIPLVRPDVFKMGYSQSGYVSFEADKLINAYAGSERKDIKLYVDVGIYERSVGSAFLPASENDFLAGNRRFKSVLQDKGYDFIYREYNEGHTWGNWRRHLIDALQYFFTNEKE